MHRKCLIVSCLCLFWEVKLQFLCFHYTLGLHCTNSRLVLSVIFFFLPWLGIWLFPSINLADDDDESCDHLMFLFFLQVLDVCVFINIYLKTKSHGLQSRNNINQHQKDSAYAEICWATKSLIKARLNYHRASFKIQERHNVTTLTGCECRLKDVITSTGGY